MPGVHYTQPTEWEFEAVEMPGGRGGIKYRPLYKIAAATFGLVRKTDFTAMMAIPLNHSFTIRSRFRRSYFN